MANPQTENGHTRIANELLEAIIRFGFTQQELQVLLAVIRKTYGYGKKEDDLGITQLAELTGQHRTHAAKTVRALVECVELLCVARKPELTLVRRSA